MSETVIHKNRYAHKCIECRKDLKHLECIKRDYHVLGFNFQKILQTYCTLKQLLRYVRM